MLLRRCVSRANFFSPRGLLVRPYSSTLPKPSDQNDIEVEPTGPGSHLLRHNDPPRAQAPDIFDLEADPGHEVIDHVRMKAAPHRIKKFPPPKLRVTNLDYDEPSFAMRSIERIQTWGLGTYHFFNNFQVLYDIKKERANGELTYQDGRIRKTIMRDLNKVINFAFAAVFFPPVALISLIFTFYNPYLKISSFHHPRDIRNFLRRTCPEVGSFSDMLDEFIGIDPNLLSLYEKEFKVDFDDYCLSADDVIRLFPHSRLAFGDVNRMNHEFLIRLSHGFPTYKLKISIRTQNFFNEVSDHIANMLLEDRIRARTPGTREISPHKLWEICHNRGLFWTLDGLELSNGQLVYLYSQWMKLALMKQKNRKTLEMLIFFIVFNVGRKVNIPDAKPSDWAFVEQYFHDFSVGAQQGHQGQL